MMIPSNEFVLLYVGRLKREKGLLELAEAFKLFRETYNFGFLIIVGPDEENIEGKIQDILQDNSNHFRLVEYVDNPEDFMASSDILVLPSHREGFGSVIIEAAACGIPAIASNIHGLSDAVVDGVTGVLFKKGNVHELVDAISFFASSTEKLQNYSKKARERAVQKFSNKDYTEALLLLYSVEISSLEGGND